MAVLAVIAALGGMLWLPAKVRIKAGSDRRQCISNLKDILLAENIWILDNDKRVSHWQTPVANGGTLGHPQTHHAWFQWSWISNSLPSPKVLVCPADLTATAASNWTDAPTGGFLNPKFQDAALSYFANMTAGTWKRLKREDLLHIDYRPPNEALMGDRAITVQGSTQACQQHTNLSYTCADPSRPAHWKTPPHGRNGNLGFIEGYVSSFESVALTSALTNNIPIYQTEASAHLLLPARP